MPNWLDKIIHGIACGMTLILPYHVSVPPSDHWALALVSSKEIRVFDSAALEASTKAAGKFRALVTNKGNLCTLYMCNYHVIRRIAINRDLHHLFLYHTIRGYSRSMSNHTLF